MDAKTNTMMNRIAKQVHYSYEDNHGVTVSVQEVGAAQVVVVSIKVSKWLWLGLGIFHWTIATQLREIIEGSQHLGIPPHASLRIVVR